MRKILLFWVVFVLFPSMLLASTGILEIYSEPSGAKIYIDDQFVGTTPYSNLNVPVGKHKVAVMLNDNYAPQYWEVAVDEVTPQVKTFRFKGIGQGEFTGIEIKQEVERYKGNVVFASVPTGAEVVINGNKRKKTPVGFKDVDVGTYMVEFTLNGKKLDGSFEVIKDDTVKIIADFENNTIINQWLEEYKQKQKDLESERGRQKYVDKCNGELLQVKALQSENKYDESLEALDNLVEMCGDYVNLVEIKNDILADKDSHFKGIYLNFCNRGNGFKKWTRDNEWLAIEVFVNDKHVKTLDFDIEKQANYCVNDVYLGEFEGNTAKVNLLSSYDFVYTGERIHWSKAGEYKVDLKQKKNYVNSTFYAEQSLFSGYAEFR